MEKLIEKLFEALFAERLKDLQAEIRRDNILRIPVAMRYLGIKSETTLKTLSKKYGFKIYGLGKQRYCFKSEINQAIKNNPIT